MNKETLDTRMRKGEYFHDLQVPEENWTVLRLDGRGFSRFTGEHFEKPFDEKFHQLMVTTTEALVEEYNALFAYTESDEISLLLPYEWDMFDREVEKMVSLSAALASAKFSMESGLLAQFDSRIWISGRLESVVDYFSWRQADATRCALNGWAYWKLREEGQSAREATEVLNGATTADKNELLFQRGVNFNDLPLWQRRGTGLYFGTYLKEGYNPVSGETVQVERRKIIVDRELEKGDEYRDWLRQRIGRDSGSNAG